MSRRPLFACLLFLACATSEEGPPPLEGVCDVPTLAKISDGAPDGHPDPFGAKAASQARAGRITDAAQIRVAEFAKYKPRVGDYVLANTKIAAYVEGARASDGYNPFGGEIVGLDVVGEDGRPLGHSQFGESLITLSRQVVAPEAVTVIADGSDGKAAIVRARGVLKNIPFLDTFQALLSNEYGYPAAIDYVLEPNAESLLVRVHLVNTRAFEETFDSSQVFGFFHASRYRPFVIDTGFDKSMAEVPWIAFDSPSSSFAVQSTMSPLKPGVSISGFDYFTAKGLVAPACVPVSTDYARYIPAAGGIDALRPVIARELGLPAFTEVRGKVVARSLGAGKGLSSAFVHAVDGSGAYLTRSPLSADGTFALHVPSFPVKLSVTASGVSMSDAVTVSSAATNVTIETPELSVLRVHAKEQGSLRALPVRVQVIPTATLVAPPKSYGIDSGSRLHQDFAVLGESELVVPAGTHRVIVTHGYEYELSDQEVTLSPGEVKDVAVTLEHSVDTTGVMCADFHVHSFYSPDSSDEPIVKVKSAIADGLDIPVSSEHEWVIDFMPMIRDLGLTDWAMSFPSEELTTFTFGHFGIIPLQPKDTELNRGAIGWYGKSPSEIFSAVHALAEKPALVVNHPSGGGILAYFGAAGFNRTTAKGNADLWSDAFDAIEVFNESDFDTNRMTSVGDWFALLDSGKNTWAVGNSDSHSIRSTPVGYPRNCFPFGHDDPKRLDANTVRDALLSGAGIVSGGLSMRVVGPGGKGPGQTDTAGTYQVTIESPSWLTAKELEVIVDGVTVETVALTATAAPGGRSAKRYLASPTVAATMSRARHYVVFHARGEGELAPLHPGRKAFAVSNPIFF